MAGVLAALVFRADSGFEPRDTTRAVYYIYWSSLFLFTWGTLAFHVADRWVLRTHYFRHWDPARLIEVTDNETSATGAHMSWIITLTLTAAFLLYGVALPGRMLTAAAPLRFAIDGPWMPVAYLWVVVAAALIVLALWNLAKGYWSRKTLAVSTWLGFAGAALLGLLVFAPSSMALNGASVGERDAAAASRMFTGKILLGIVAVSLAIRELRQWRSWRAMRATHRTPLRD